VQTSSSHRSKFLLVPNSPPPPLKLEHPITFRPVRLLRRHGSLAGVQVPRRVRARRDQPVRRMHEERAAPVRRRRLLRDLAGREDASDARVRQEQKLRRLHGGLPWQLLVHGLRLHQPEHRH